MPQETKATDADFLRQQAEVAKAAIQKALGQIRGDAATVVDPRAWMQDYPWWPLAGAAIGGFALAAALVPDSDDHAPTAPPAEGPRQNGSAAASAPKPNPARTLLAGLAHEALGILRPAILSAISAGIAARARNSSPEPAPTDPADADATQI